VATNLHLPEYDFHFVKGVLPKMYIEQTNKQATLKIVIHLAERSINHLKCTDYMQNVIGFEKTFGMKSRDVTN